MGRPTPKNTQTEYQTRANLIGWAKKYGAEEELIKIFNRYDDLLKGAKNKEEIAAISAMGLIEVDNFFTGKKSFDNLAVKDRDVADELMKIKEGK